MENGRWFVEMVYLITQFAAIMTCQQSAIKWTSGVIKPSSKVAHKTGLLKPGIVGQHIQKYSILLEHFAVKQLNNPGWTKLLCFCHVHLMSYLVLKSPYKWNILYFKLSLGLSVLPFFSECRNYVFLFMYAMFRGISCFRESEWSKSIRSRKI